MNWIKYIIPFFLLVSSVYAQEKLTLNEAVKITLANNYDIKLAENSKIVAKNNASIYNSGYLPQITARAGTGFKSQSINTEYHEGNSMSIDGAKTLTHSASIGLYYSLFNGMTRSYNYQKLKELYDLSDIQAKLVMENALMQLFSSFYNVANLTENTVNLKQMLEISQHRKLRVYYNVEYGKNTQLDLLNAQVDVNNDSISYLNALQQLENSKRDLNVILGRDINQAFITDTTVNYQNMLSLSDLITKANENNTQIRQVDKNIALSVYDLKIAKSNNLPEIGLSANYGYNGFNYDTSNLIDLQNINGPSIELNLTWNIFDGGMTKVRTLNARRVIQNQEIQKQQTEQQIEKEVTNAWATFQNSLFVLKAEQNNLITNQRNFDRTQEKYQLGQLTSVEFRQAQINLLLSKTKYNQAKYNTKFAELSLRNICGSLLEMGF